VVVVEKLQGLSPTWASYAFLLAASVGCRQIWALGLEQGDKIQLTLSIPMARSGRKTGFAFDWLGVL